MLRVALSISLLGLLILGVWSAFEGRNVMLEERKNSVKNIVQVAQAIVSDYTSRVNNGSMIQSQAQKEALEKLQSMKYGKNGYLFVFNNNLKLLIIGNNSLKKLENKSVKDRADSNGFLYYQRFLKVGDTGGGYVNYISNLPDSGQRVKKVSYISKFSPWDWYIGSGVFLNDIDDIFYKSLIQYFLMIMLVSLTVSAVMLLTIRSTQRSLGGDPIYSRKIIEYIADGNLNTIISLRTGDSTSLLAMMAKMQQRLAEVVMDVRRGADQMQLFSHELSQGNNDLSRRTEEQVSSLQETAASIEQLTATVKLNADNSRQARDLVAETRNLSTNATKIVDKTIFTMQGINDQVDKMDIIISTIENIAFQTHILALNAAVEAARAGKQGLGFAVIAAEVGQLAKTSASAAKEIKLIITLSTEHISNSSKMIIRVGQSMDVMMESITRVSDLITQISDASHEQSQGINQVNIAIAHIDQVTQQNSSLVEQGAVATIILNEQALELQKKVSKFKIN